MSEYDSTHDILRHQERVGQLLTHVVRELIDRALFHDKSKLSPKEKSIFDKSTPLLKDLTYGSSEYNQALKDIKPALDHHYEVNQHHPEHFSNSIEGMTLIDLLEMLCDWIASTERVSNGDIQKSLHINQKRFYICPQLMTILRNTVRFIESEGKLDQCELDDVAQTEVQESISASNDKEARKLYVCGYEPLCPECGGIAYSMYSCDESGFEDIWRCLVVRQHGFRIDKNIKWQKKKDES